MDCPKCGYQCSPGWKQCPICGQMLAVEQRHEDAKPRSNLADQTKPLTSSQASWLERLKKTAPKEENTVAQKPNSIDNFSLDDDDIFADDPLEKAKRLLNSPSSEPTPIAKKQIPVLTASKQTSPVLTTPVPAISAPVKPINPIATPPPKVAPMAEKLSPKKKPFIDDQEEQEETGGHAYYLDDDTETNGSLMTVMEFDDDDSILSQQIDDLLSDNIESVEAVHSHSRLPVINGNSTTIVEDDIEIEIEFEVKEETGAATANSNKKPAPATISSVGGLLENIESLTKKTNNVSFSKTQDLSSEKDPLVAMLKKGLQKNKKESVQERLQSILQNSESSTAIKELCSLVAEAYGITTPSPESMPENKVFSEEAPAAVKMPVEGILPSTESTEKKTLITATNPLASNDPWEILDDALSAKPSHLEIDILLTELTNAQPSDKISAIFDTLEYELICGKQQLVGATKTKTAFISNNNLQKAFEEFEHEEKKQKVEREIQKEDPFAYQLNMVPAWRKTLARLIDISSAISCCLLFSFILFFPNESKMKLLNPALLISEDWLPYLPRTFLSFCITLTLCLYFLSAIKFTSTAQRLAGIKPTRKALIK
ncbi:MAG: zinc ribbon domain-containing protein [Deltaproteobacteria bacterium]|nr:zinc ribbon domain-containing protein [Deltaproteobacteria bacterium]